MHAVHLLAAGTCEEVTVARLVSRINRMHGAMTALTRMPDEERVAESILGHHSPPELLGDSPSGPSGIITIDLRNEALGESRRLGRCRAFAAASAHIHMPDRSVMTHVRRHQTSNSALCLWVYRLVLTTSEGRLVWEALVPIAGSLEARRRCSIRLMRTLLNSDWPPLQTVLANHCAVVLQQLRPSVRPMLERYSAREHSLASVLRSRHARLSAGLLQRSLFDRRDERLASAQTSLLEEALSQSASRLRELGGFDDLRIDAAELVFAVLLD